jgi:hypothetical protein
MIVTAIFLCLVSLVICQDCSTDICPQTETCCFMGQGIFACCPYTNAVCCADERHCCPTGYTCDLQEGICVSSDDSHDDNKEEVTDMTILYPIETEKDDACAPTSCPTNETCCPIGIETACCPFPSAVCCSDQLHCCPSGHTCDIEHGQCNPTSFTIIPSPVVKSQAEANDCPTGTCTSTQTCCAVSSGMFGCCPYPSGVCCADLSHCCPNSYTCDLEHNQCISGYPYGIYATKLMESLELVEAVHGDDCPSNTCGSTESCCKVSSGQWGCCPFQNASCCADVCCPSGYSCDFATHQCINTGATESMPLVSLLQQS